MPIFDISELQGTNMNEGDFQLPLEISAVLSAKNNFISFLFFAVQNFWQQDRYSALTSD